MNNLASCYPVKVSKPRAAALWLAFVSATIYGPKIALTILAIKAAKMAAKAQPRKAPQSTVERAAEDVRAGMADRAEAAPAPAGGAPEARIVDPLTPPPMPVGPAANMQTPDGLERAS